MIEMTFHAKALELLTIAYQRVDEINEKADLEVGDCLNFYGVNPFTLNRFLRILHLAMMWVLITIFL